MYTRSAGILFRTLVPPLLLLFGLFVPAIVFAGAGGPLPTVADRILEGIQPSERFGASVATAGDVNGDGYSDIIVGMPAYDNGANTDAGRVMVFHGSATGFSGTPAWTMNGTMANARFGHSVSTAGDVNGDGISDIIIGAPGHAGQGAVFVYHGSPAGLLLLAAWSAISGEAGSGFGTSVALAGDVNSDNLSDVLVGAPLMNELGADRGKVFCYRGSLGTGVVALPLWTWSGLQDYAQFGFSVAGAGDLNGDGRSDVVIGEPYLDVSLTDRGRVHVFHGNGIGLTFSVTRDGPSSNAHFGYAVSSAGDMNGDGYGELLVGAPGYSTERGRLYGFRGGASGIEATATSIYTGTQASARLGSSVSLAGDVNVDGFADVVVGAPLYDGAFTDGGRAFLFIGASGAGSHFTTAYRTYDGTLAGAQLGFSVQTCGDANGDGASDLLLGGPEHAVIGRVTIYHGGPDVLSLPTVPAWSQQPDVANANMGSSVEQAGDVNGDGFSDVIVGLPGVNQARVYLGSATGLLSTYWSATGSATDEQFGYCVSSAGDVNGDGYSDVIIGGYAHDSFRGRAYVYLGSPTGLGAAYHWRVTGAVAAGRFGGAVSSAGDVNGDGYSDIIVGAYHENNRGAVHGYYGGPAGLSPTASWTVAGAQVVADYASVITGGGDVDADGYDDVLVGAQRHDNAGLGQCGAVFLYRGSVSGLSNTPAWVQYGDQHGAEFGYDVSYAGDVNGDGFSDVVIGAYLYDNGEVGEGRSYVYHGSLSGLGTTPVWAAESDFPDAQWGSSASSAGDVNGDGYSDVIIGGFRYAQAYLGEGRASVYYGSAAGLTVASAWTALGGATNRNLGYSLAGAGDVNGDGYGDVIVGVPGYSNGQSLEGFCAVYLGNFQRSRQARTRQYRSDLTTPVQTSNGTFQTDCSWGIGQDAWSSMGRSKLKLVWEHKGHAPPFQGAPFSNWTGYSGEDGAWTDSGLSGSELKRVLSINDGSTAHPAWRTRIRHHPATLLDGRVFGRWFYHGIQDDQVPSVKTEFGGCGLLPIQLLWQHVKCTSSGALLEWSTATEQNCSGFEVERSLDAEQWEQVGFVGGAGNSAVQHEYNYEDAMVPNGVVYYRLRQIDLDGSFDVLPIMALDPCADDQRSMVAWPSPVQDVVSIAVKGVDELHGSSVELYDATGRMVRSVSVRTEGRSARIDMGGMAPGTYALILIGVDNSKLGHVRVVRE
ncbi:MAG TPA: FG-GAP-like repeat-containing protein [Flavobacteriales bacterium]|nr:FG-GAP-like repeat-containing protein [Flavobacteriales bacterium]